MSLLKVEPQIFKWLQSIQITKDGKRNSQNKIQLSENASNCFFDGLYVSKILKKIIQNQSQINQNLLTKMKTIKQNSTPAIRLYNWNLIADVLKYYKYNLDYVQKSKILNLQPQPIYKILSYLKDIYKNQNTSQNSNQNYSSIQSNNPTSLSRIKQPQIPQNKLHVDVNTIGTKKLSECNNIMQFFVISLSKNFKLSPLQTLNLFLDKNKYLAHLLVKGLKDSFQPIINFQNQIYNNLQFIALTIFSIDQQKSIQFFFQGIKACLISKDLQVSLRCLDIFQKLYQIYKDNQLDQSKMLLWIRKEGINTLLFSSKRHQSTLQKAIEISFNLIENQLFQYIRPSEKSPFWSNDTQKLTFYNSFLFVAQNNVLNQFSKSTCIIQWNTYCLKSIKKLKSTPDIKILIKILHRKWIQFPQFFTSDGQLSQNYVSFLKGSSFSNDFMLFTDSIKIMFDLMQILGKRKNNYAPILYKTLVTCLSFQSSQERIMFIIQNFIYMFGQIQSLPGSLIVDPLLRSIQRKSTTSSLALCKFLVVQQKIKQEDMIEVINVLTKVFFQDPYQGSLAIQYIFQCLQFIDSDIKNEFITSNSQLCLSHLYSLSKSIKKSFQQLKSNFKRYQNQSSMKQGQQLFLNQIKKYLIIQNFMKFFTEIIKNEQQSVLTQLEQPIFMTYLKIKYDLQKQYVAEIIRNNLMRKYYDIEEELVAVVQKYQKKYRYYIDQLNNRHSSLSVESEEEQSPIQNKSINQSRLYNSKSMNLDHTIDQNNKSNLKRSIFKPQKSALNDLQTLKSKMIKMKMMSQQTQKKKDLIQDKKQLMRSVLNQRRMVRFGTKSQVDLQYKYLQQFDSVKTQNINGMPNIQILNFQNDQQDMFISDVDSLMKKYRKIWRFLFFKFSTFGTKNSKQIKIQQKINISEVWKMHKDYETDFIKKQQNQVIIRLINQNMKRKNDLQNLTYLGFEEYIVQYCIYSYNKIGLSSLSPGQKVTKFIEKLKQRTSQKGGNIQIFQNPQQVYFQQTQVIRQFNKRLNQNPDYILPQGYKKVKLTQFNYFYEHKQQTKKSFQHAQKKFSYNQSYFDVMEVLDMIFFQNQKLGFHIVEPKIQQTQKIIAKPVLFQQLNQKMKNYKNGYLMPKRQINSTYIASRQKVNPVKPEFHPLVQFSLGIKLGLAGVPLKNKYIGQQVAYWMDDMLDAVQHGSLKVLNKGAKKIQNQAIKKKKLLLFQYKNEIKEKQKFYKQRSQSVKSQFQKIQLIKAQNNKKRISQAKLKQLQQKKRQQKQMNKKLRQFQKAKQYFTQIHQKQKQKQFKQKQVKKIEKEEYKKNVEQYFKKKKAELQERQLNLKKDRQFQKKKQQQQAKKKKQLQKKVYFSVLKKDEQALQKILSVKDKYQEFSNQSFVRQQLQLHRKPLQMLFDLLLKHQKSKISATDANQISQNTLHFFTLKFKIVPFILQKNMLSKIFISIGKQYSNKAGFGLSFKGFQQALLKIIIKSKKMLNDLVQKRRQKLLNSSKQIKQQQMQNQQGTSQQLKLSKNNSKLGQSKVSIFSQNNLSTQYLFDPQGVTQSTIRQFMIFLNLPDDKISLEKRYRQAIESKNNKAALVLRKQLIENNGIV